MNGERRDIADDIFCMSSFSLCFVYLKRTESRLLEGVWIMWGNLSFQPVKQKDHIPISLPLSSYSLHN